MEKDGDHTQLVFRSDLCITSFMRTIIHRKSQKVELKKSVCCGKKFSCSDEDRW